MSTSRDWLNRYHDGHRQQVWLELHQLGASVREPELADEAQQVCDEMARRARQNVETIVGRLTEQGYQFHSNDNARTPVVPHHPPTPDASDLARWLAGRFGPVPLTLLSWLRLVGDAWLAGTHPRWSGSGSASADPVVTEVEGAAYPGSSMRDFFEEEFKVFQESAEEDWPFVLPLAPDRLHKGNVSGGMPYGIVVPDSAVDGVFAAEVSMPFVSYLNEVFRNGGFAYAMGSETEHQIKQALAKDLLAL